MRTNYAQARELLRQAQLADTPEMAALLIAEAQVHATLALVDATKDAR